MLWVKILSFADTIEQQSNKSGMRVKFKIRVTQNIMTALA